MHTVFAQIELMHTCDALKRYMRCAKIGNPVTIKLAKRDLIHYIPRMKPIDLVNTVKTCHNETEIASATVDEILSRKFSKFNQKDVAVLLPSIRLLEAGTRNRFLTELVPRLTPFLPAMRPTDICISLWALTKVGVACAEIQSVLAKALEIFAQENFKSMKSLSSINITQLLLAFSKYSKSNKAILPVFEQLLTLMTANNYISQIKDDALAFYIYSVANISQSVEMKMKNPQRISFFSSIQEEVKQRNALSPIQRVDCARGLDRAGFCDRELVEVVLVRVLDSKNLKLKPEQRDNINSILRRFSYPMTI